VADLVVSEEFDLSGTTAVGLDVDGTIAGPDHRVSVRTRAAMAEIESLGIPVVLATGRSRANVLDVAVETGLRTPGVSCNGAVVTDPVSGDDLRVRTMDPAEVEALRRVHEETGAAFTWWTARDIFTTTEQLRDLLTAFGDPDVSVAALPERMSDDVVKAMIHGTPAELDAAQPVIERHTPRATRSMDIFWELSDPDAQKWSGISYVFDLLGVDPAGAVGLGDGENDVVWMREIGLPVAMGNARPEARAVARAVTGHHAQEGAADVLEEVLRQIRRRAA
jgi:Cof subfamily protein (haloacid dehalogenase superfamily)